MAAAQNFRIAEDQSLAATWPLISADIERIAGPQTAPVIPGGALPPGGTAAYAVTKLEPGEATLIRTRNRTLAIEAATRRHPEALYRDYYKAGDLTIIERVR